MRKTYKSPAKLNICLKITGVKDEYHTIASRFVRVDDLADTLWFEPSPFHEFEVIGEFDCELKQNTLYKAYRAMVLHTGNKRIIEFCKAHRVYVNKVIPAYAGLGGGSSNAATFMRALNHELNLGLSLESLCQIGLEVGADVPFFLHGCASANVYGIGEKIHPFEETLRGALTIHPNLIRCETKEVYKIFRKHFLKDIDAKLAHAMLEEPSEALLSTYGPATLNDLLPAALKRYPELMEFAEPGRFFTGSGSCFFSFRAA